MKDFVPFLFSILAVLGLFILSYLVMGVFVEKDAQGTFGDSFGAINALFSGFAFAGIIATIWLQRKELVLQREELKLTRDELTKSAKAQDKSQIALNHQVNLMTKQAVLAAYQSRYSSRVNYLASKYGGQEERKRFRDELFELDKKIDDLIVEIEKVS